MNRWQKGVYPLDSGGDVWQGFSTMELSTRGGDFAGKTRWSCYIPAPVTVCLVAPVVGTTHFLKPRLSVPVSRRRNPGRFSFRTRVRFYG